MKHYIQYHNTEKQGGRPGRIADGYAIFSNKSIRHLQGQRVWLISGAGAKKKSFYLESTFVVDLVEEGAPSVAKGVDGTRFDPPIPLTGLPWFEDFKQRQQNFSLGVREIDATAVQDFEHIVSENADQEDAAHARADQLTPDDFFFAMKALESKLNDAQREMLVGHANAINSTLSMGRLAVLAGYKGYEAANIQYGRIGAWLAEELGVAGLVHQTYALATVSSDRDYSGHSQWVMRPALVVALRRLWPELVLQESVELAAAAEIDSDSQCSELKATERAALIQARVGQGAYRRKLIDLWQGRCAVTGCDIETVLVASHAKPWCESTNQERLDPFNGLLLAASVDRLFDTGMISFSDDGWIIVCPGLTDIQLSRVGLSRESRLSRVEEHHLPYLRAHRSQVFGKK